MQRKTEWSMSFPISFLALTRTIMHIATTTTSFNRLFVTDATTYFRHTQHVIHMPVSGRPTEEKFLSISFLNYLVEYYTVYIYSVVESMLLLLSILFVLLCRASLFDGKWSLAEETLSGSCDEVLRFLGINDAQIRLINSLSVTDNYDVTRETVRIRRNALLTHSDNTFRIGVEEMIQDPIVGIVRQTMLLPNSRRWETYMFRKDGSKFMSTRRIPLDDNNRIYFSHNYTTIDNRSASCVRYFTKL